VTGGLPDPFVPPVLGEPRARRGGIGPFSWRQLLSVVVIIGVAALALTLATRPIGAVPAAATALPESTAYVVGPAVEGLRPGDIAPELEVDREDGTTFTLTDLDGNPVRLADLRGKLVWLNFWATWCPPCQAETPVLRDIAARYRDQGLEIVGVAVQETTVDDVRAYAERYGIGYPIAFDASADIFRLYRVFALPTQVFIGPDGRILSVVNGPMTEGDAERLIRANSPPGPDPT
jgi:cytochrome c biogenesis protein CcmG/thiol:disulfide interchange protein DsbE